MMATLARPMLLADVDLHPALAGLVDALPAAGEMMRIDERKRFLAAMDAVLSFLYPERDPAQRDIFE